MEGLTGVNEAQTLSVTVEEFIKGVILKELWAAQLRRVPTDEGTWFEPLQCERLVPAMVPSVTRDVLGAVVAWIPAISEVSPQTLLPDLDQYPPSAVDIDGLNIVQRKLLLEALEIVLEVFFLNEGKDTIKELGIPDVDVEELEFPLMPKQGLACVAAQIGAVLEHFALLQQARFGGMDIGTWTNKAGVSISKSRVAAGSKQELIEELQQCRQRIFDLEKDMVSQSKANEALASRGKRECDKALSRLLTVNAQLEDKLKQRTDEHRTATKLGIDQSRRLEHNHWQMGEKDRAIHKLESDIAKFMYKQDDLLAREKEHGERALRMQIEEYESISRHNERAKRLQDILDGKLSSSEGMEEDEEDLSGLAKRKLEEVQSEFRSYFEAQQARLIQSMQQCEASVQQRCVDLQEQESVVLDAYRAAYKRPIVQSLAVQTEPIAMLRGKAMEMALGCGATNVAHELKGSALLPPTPMDRTSSTPNNMDARTNRRTIHGTPDGSSQKRKTLNTYDLPQIMTAEIVPIRSLGSGRATVHAQRGSISKRGKSPYVSGNANDMNLRTRSEPNRRHSSKEFLEDPFAHLEEPVDTTGPTAPGSKTSPKGASEEASTARSCSCGIVHTDDSAFCRKCGKRCELPEGTSAPKGASMTAKKGGLLPPRLCECGCQLMDDSLFCRKCGTKWQPKKDTRRNSALPAVDVNATASKSPTFGATMSLNPMKSPLKSPKTAMLSDDVSDIPEMAREASAGAYPVTLKVNDSPEFHDPNGDGGSDGSEP